MMDNIYTGFLKNIQFSIHSKNNTFALAEGLISGREGRSKLNLGYAEVLVSWSVSPQKTKTQVFLSLAVTKGQLSNSTLQGVVELDWAKENYLLMPGAVYNGNRYEVYPCEYPPFLPFNPKNGPVITDVPRLEIGDGPSKLELAAGDMTTPAAGFYAPALQKGFFVTSPHRCDAGYYGYTAAENDARSRLTITLSAPVLRSKMYNMCNASLISDDTGFNLSEGQKFDMSFSLHEFDCTSVPALFEYLAGIRKEYNASSFNCTLPFSAAFRLIEEKFNRDGWMETDGFYCLTTKDAGGYGCWQPGWVGGGMIESAFLSEGQPLTVGRCLDMMDFVLGKAQTPNGFFYGFYASTGFGGDSFLDKTNTSIILLRKQTDLLYFLIKQLEQIKQQGLAPDRIAGWESKVRLTADALARLWQKNGHWGQFITWTDECILIDGTLSCVSGCAALALAARYFSEPRYLEIASEAGEYYYRQFVAHGIANGGPGEILQNPDSESAFGALESFVTLYEATKENRWLDYAKQAARICASWCVSYNFDFPADSGFGKLGMPTIGCVWANAQNKHAAPGICTFSGDSLFRLYRYTGDLFSMQLCRDIAHAIPWFVCRPDRPIVSFDGKEQSSGWINERCNMSDWEGKSRIGEVFYGSCWSETSMALTYTELPGIYVEIEARRVWVLDHMLAAIEEQPSGLTLVIQNPTAFDAVVRVQSVSEAGQFSELVEVKANDSCSVPLQG